MKKLFTLVCAAILSVSLWAEYDVPAEGTVDLSAESTAKVASNGQFRVIASGLYAFRPGSGYSYSNGNGLKTQSNAGGFVFYLNAATKVTATIKHTESKNAHDVTISVYDLSENEYKQFDDKKNESKGADRTYTLDLSDNSTTNSFTIAVAAESKNFTGTKELAAGYYAIIPSGEKGNTYLNAIAFEIACTDPKFTVSPTEGTGFVGDPIDIAVTSKNQSKPINAAVTVDGVAGVYGTDYTFSVSTGLVQATPLKAGTFVITFTQASNGTYCDAEESATFVISEKAPVTTFEVAGPTSARVGDEITLTAKNFDAAATSIWWTDKYGQTLASTAEYTFTPEADGTIELTAWAENDFNTNPVTVEHNVTVTIGHNALLSDLKVNGITVDGFDDEVFEYNLGEIGVYEALNVVATPADAPYATAVVNVATSGVSIVVSAQDKTTLQTYHILFTRAAATTLASISGDATWDFTKTGATEIKLTDSSLPTKTDEFVYADMLTNPDASFNAAALAGIQEYVVRDGKYCQGLQLKFNTTVPGTLEVIYCNTGNRSDEGDRRFLVVNGEKIGEGSMISSKNDTISNISVAAGEVVLTGLLKKDESAQYLRFHKVTFTKSSTTALENTAEEPKATKRIVNGQLIIEKNGEVYNVLGARVR